MSRLLILASITTVIIALLIFGVHLTSTNKAIAPADLKDYQCSPQPCWHQIYLGKTQLEEAESGLREDSTVKLTAFPEQGLCWTTIVTARQSCLWSNTEGLVTAINLAVGTPIRLGDMLAILGQPEGVKLCWMSTVSVTDNPPMFMDVYFPDGIDVSASYYHPFWGGQLTPNQLIDLIRYNTARNEIPDSHSWRGFSWLDDLPKSSGC